MHFLVDVSSTPPGSRIKLESEISGTMAIISAWRWAKRIKTGLVPSTRRLGALSQATSI
jgi:hypothetical protein